jgi:hypothetical protein
MAADLTANLSAKPDVFWCDHPDCLTSLISYPTNAMLINHMQKIEMLFI